MRTVSENSVPINQQALELVVQINFTQRIPRAASLEVRRVSKSIGGVAAKQDSHADLACMLPEMSRTLDALRVLQETVDNTVHAGYVR